jgi:hypothetical protein
LPIHEMGDHGIPAGVERDLYLLCAGIIPYGF